MKFRLPALTVLCVALLIATNSLLHAEEPKKDSPKETLDETQTDLYKIPEGTGTGALVAFCKAIQDFRPTSRQEVAQHKAKATPALVDACKKILLLDKNPASTDGHFARQTLVRLGLPTLRNPNAPIFAFFLQEIATLAQYEKLDENDCTLLLQVGTMLDSVGVAKATPERVTIDQAAERYLDNLAQLAESGKIETRDIPSALRLAALVKVLRPEKSDSFAQKLERAADRYIDETGQFSEANTLGVKDIPNALGAVSCLELIYPGKEEVFLKRIGKAIDKYLDDEAKSVEGDTLNPRDVSRTMNLGSTMQHVDSARAARFYERLGKAFEKSKLPIADLAMKTIPSILRRLNLPGNVMELKGRTMDGKDFDLASLAGKVVLVNFWGTVYAPSRAEMPNVMKAYAAYHNKGFEVVGISVDEDRNALERFLKDSPLPWTTLHETEAGKYKPIEAIDKYSIHAFPTTILVGKDGKVIQLNVRGPKLFKLLKELLGEPDEAK